MLMEDETKWYEKEYIPLICFASVVFIPVGAVLLWKFGKQSTKVKSFVAAVSLVPFAAFSFLVYKNFSPKPEPAVKTVVELPEKKPSSKSENKKEESKTESKKSEKTEKTEKDKPKVVYITKNGKKYHYSKSCGKGSYKAVSLSEAVKKGYKPCKRCAK